MTESESKKGKWVLSFARNALQTGTLILSQLPCIEGSVKSERRNSIQLWFFVLFFVRHKSTNKWLVEQYFFFFDKSVGQYIKHIFLSCEWPSLFSMHEFLCFRQGWQLQLFSSESSNQAIWGADDNDDLVQI